MDSASPEVTKEVAEVREVIHFGDFDGGGEHKVGGEEFGCSCGGKVVDSGEFIFIFHEWVSGENVQYNAGDSKDREGGCQ